MKKNEKLFHGGTVCTVDPGLPAAEAVAVRDGIIIAAGSVSSCRAALDRGYEPVDLKGGTLLPGFCDAHMHPLPTIIYAMKCNLLGVRDLDELIKRLKQSSCDTGEHGWVIGLNFDELGMTPQQLPTRFDLDRVSTDKPVLVLRHDGHSLLANSLALKIAGITKETRTPEGGTIDRDEHGEPLGIFRENAMALVLSHASLPTPDELIAGARKAFDIMLGYGITSLGLIMEADQQGRGGAFGDFDLAAIELAEPYIRQSLYSFLIAREAATIEKVRGSALHNSHGTRRIGGLKIISDGTFGSYTAAMDEPFSDDPGNTGFMFYEEPKLYDLMVQAHNTGCQIAVHAIGDRANRSCIAMYDRLLREYPRKDHRHRIEHASIMDEAMLRKVKELGLVLSVQPMFIHSDMPYLAKRIGEERMRNTYPFRSMAQAGIPMAASSDSPIETQNVLASIECAVTREGYVTSQALSPEQAIHMYTLGAAYAQFEEHIRGSITPGKRADFVLLQDNPLKVRPDEIHSIGVLRTFIDGEPVYSK